MYKIVQEQGSWSFFNAGCQQGIPTRVNSQIFY